MHTIKTPKIIKSLSIIPITKPIVIGIVLLFTLVNIPFLGNAQSNVASVNIPTLGALEHAKSFCQLIGLEIAGIGQTNVKSDLTVTHFKSKPFLREKNLLLADMDLYKFSTKDSTNFSIQVHYYNQNKKTIPIVNLEQTQLIQLEMNKYFSK